MPASRRVQGVPEQLPGRVPAGPGLLRERVATRVERAPQTHRQTNSIDHRPGNVSYDLVELSWRYLPLKRPLRTRQYQVDGLALRPAAANFIHHGGGRQ